MNISQPPDLRCFERDPSSAQRIEANPPEDDGPDLRALLLTLWRGRWIITVCVLLVTIAGWLFVSQMRPTYTATASVLFTGDKSRIIDLGDGVIAQDPRRDSLQNEIEILNSTSLMNRVVEKLNLERDPEFNPRLRTEFTPLEQGQAWFGEQMAAAKGLLASFGIAEPPRPTVQKDAETQAKALRRSVIARAQGKITLQPVRGSRVMRISATADDPGTAARLANTLVDQFIIGQMEARLQATREATGWLSTRVDELRQQVQEVEEKVQFVRAQVAEETGQGVEITRQQLQSVNAALASAQANRSAAVARLQRLEMELDSGGDLSAVPEIRDSEIIAELRQQQARLRAQEASLTASVAEDHPVRAQLRQRIQEIEASIRDEAERIRATLRNVVESARANEAALKAEVKELEELTKAQSQSDIQLRQLEREAEASRALYENFLARLKETSEQAKLQEAEARVLSPAEPPLGPNALSGRRILAGSAAGGLALGIALVFLLERLNNTFRGPPQIEEATGLRVIGSLPAIGRRMRREKVVKRLQEKPNSSLAEAVRNLRTSIFLANIDEPPKTVMITSSMPREGKSTAAMLLALTIRQMGKSAIIVDCDLRMPSLTALFSKGEGKGGLLSVLEGESTLEEAIRVEETTGLHALMARDADTKLGVSSADILSSQRFRELIRTLGQTYDLVILDTPPVLAVADPRIISSLADAVIYAVKWDSTPRGAVLEGLKEMRSVGAPLTGIAFIMIDEAKAAYYTYEGYGYYRRKHQGYYVE